MANLIKPTNQQADRAAEVLHETVQEATGTGPQAAHAAHVLHESVKEVTGTVVVEATRIADDATRSGVNAAADTVQRAVEQAPQVLGSMGEQGRDMAQNAAQNLETVTQASAVLARGAQDLTREFMEFTQQSLTRNVEGLTALARCRSPSEFFALQSSLVQDTMQHLMEGSRRIAERSMQVANGVAQSVAEQTSPNAQSERRAA